MLAVMLDLFPLLCRGLLLGGSLLFGFIYLWVVLPDPTSKLVVCALATIQVPALVVAAWRGRWLWPFVARTRRFRTASSDRVVLRYAPEVGAAEAEGVLHRAEEALAELEATFGRLTLFWHGRTFGPLLFRRRVHVYLFPRAEAVREVFGELYGATALMGLHAVMIPFKPDRLDEVLKHELAHLFTDRWNPWAPPLFREGVPTWLRGSIGGSPMNRLAAALLRGGERRLRPLLEWKAFFARADRWQHYVLAGSFTGFLIGRFGWDAYRRFYRRVSGRRGFDARFKQHFGLTLEEAEVQWREGLPRTWRAWLIGEEGLAGYP
jgi:hypothetical protein